jgi:hypothetical protein
MIGIATTVFWIFLIAFISTAVYSAKDLQLMFGEPQIGTTTDNKMLFSMPITIINNGLYDIDNFGLRTRIKDKDGNTITRGTTNIPIVKKGEEVTATHNMTIDVNDLLQRDQNYLFNDTEMRIYETGTIGIAEIISVQASTNFSMPWGAPLYNFALGANQSSLFNSTHVRVVIPISFENHALFDLAGNITIEMYNSTDALIGEGETSIDAMQNSPYSGSIQLLVQAAEMTGSGHFEVYFETSFFDYGPMVIPYG